jgi:CheY-like chemotaxis protein
LILTDLLLPDRDGAALAKEILELVREPKPPVIAVTAYSTPEKRAEAAAAGIVGFVTKPISRHKLEAAILSLGDGLRRPIQPIEIGSAGDWDFRPLLRLPDGRRHVAEFVAEVPRAWDDVRRRAEAGDPSARRAVHAFRGRILVVHAQSLSEQLAILESLLNGGDPADVGRMLGVLAPMVNRLAEAGSAEAVKGD